MKKAELGYIFIQVMELHGIVLPVDIFQMKTWIYNMKYTANGAVCSLL